MLVLIPRLHKLFRRFGRISGSWQPSFFVKLAPCHSGHFKAAYPIYSIFNILHSSINSKTALILQKVRKNIRVMVAIFNLFSSSHDLVTLITSKPLIRFTQYLAYCILVLIPRLLQFFRKFVRISGS